MVRCAAAVGVTLVVCALAGRPVAAADRTDIPLKNWGGFSIVRDAAYDDLERLATAGLFDRAILNTKPLSRAEAARLVARAIEKIRADTAGVYNNRQDREPDLHRLTHEPRPALRSRGGQLEGARPTPAPRFFTLRRSDRPPVRGR